MRTRPVVVTVVALLALGTAGCADDEAQDVAAAPAASPSATPAATPSATPVASPSAAAASPSPSTSTAPSPSPSPSPSPTDEELAALGVNELGRVLVAEWHRLGDADGEYRTSRETFRRQLATLHERGYRPVTQQEFLAGTFPIPAGTSPVLLTFDDSTRGQFTLDEDGVPPADTAVGILEAFADEHPGWRATAVFAYNFPDPFGDGGYEPKLRWLVDNGYELSNHSRGHVNLGTLSGDEVVERLASNQALLHAVVPDAPVPSLTLPLGIWPDDPATAISGTGPDGTTYQHDLVYLVGSDPTRSPHHAEFDPHRVQRVPAHAVVGTGPAWFWDWLDRLDDDGLRFVSDGDPEVVTYPAALADVADVAAGFRTRTYGTP